MISLNLWKNQSKSDFYGIRWNRSSEEKYYILRILQLLGVFLYSFILPLIPILYTALKMPDYDFIKIRAGSL